MVGPPIGPRRLPDLIDGLMVLPPAVRLAAGGVMLVLGGAAIAISTSVYAIVLVLLAGALGVPLVLSGTGALRERRLDCAGRERAEGELPALRAAIAQAVADRHNVSRQLRLRGYTSPRVRRWIALECGVVLARGDHQARAYEALARRRR